MAFIRAIGVFWYSLFTFSFTYFNDILALSSIICGVITQNRYQPDSFNSPGGNGGGAGGNGGENGDTVGQDGLGSLEEAIPGIPGYDYPLFAEVPETSFLCDG